MVTNIEAGQPEDLRLRDMHKEIVAVQASASLPLVSRNVKIGGRLYLDGGLSDSVPIMHSIVDGNRKNVVVLTKEVGYRREPSKHLELVRIRYAKYPKIYELMANRHTAYKRMLDYREQREKNGQTCVTRPQKTRGVGRWAKETRTLCQD